MRAGRPLLVVAVLLLAIWGAVAWWGSDRRRIERELEEIRELVSKSPGEVPLLALDRARRVADHFAAAFELRARQYDFSATDRRTLIGGIHRYRSASDRFEMRVVDRELTIDPQLGRATHHLEVEFESGWLGGEGREAYRFQVNWVAADGEWKIDFVDLLEILEGPPRALW